MSARYKYERPAVTVDCVLFGIDEGELKLLLIRRNLEPFKGQWALPGGFVRVDESLEEAAYRELKEETGVTQLYLEQLYTFGSVDRDPRERVITVAYYALVNLYDYPVKAATDASEAAWFAVSDLPPLAFDHRGIIAAAHTRLQNKLHYEPVGFELLPRKFTLTELQRLYEIIWDKPLDKRNFRKKILTMGVLIGLDEVQKDVAHRAARLYRFDRRNYERLKKGGFFFEV